MACIKTGALLRVEAYNTDVICDLYNVADCIIGRFYPEHWNNKLCDDKEVTHIVEDLTDSFVRIDIGIIVFPSINLKRN